MRDAGSHLRLETAFRLQPTPQLDRRVPASTQPEPRRHKTKITTLMPRIKVVLRYKIGDSSREAYCLNRSQRPWLRMTAADKKRLSF